MKGLRLLALALVLFIFSLALLGGILAGEEEFENH